MSDDKPIVAITVNSDPDTRGRELTADETRRLAQACTAALDCFEGSDITGVVVVAGDRDGFTAIGAAVDAKIGPVEHAGTMSTLLDCGLRHFQGWSAAWLKRAMEFARKVDKANKP